MPPSFVTQLMLAGLFLCQTEGDGLSYVHERCIDFEVYAFR